MTTIKPPAPNPCISCPYRRDVPSGVWHENEYAKLRTYDGETWDQNPRLFQCHQNGTDSDEARLCGGWVACHNGEELLALRMAWNQMSEDDAQEAMRYTTKVPVFESGAAAAEHGMRDYESPSEDASTLTEKIKGRRNDVRYG